MFSYSVTVALSWFWLAPVLQCIVIYNIQSTNCNYIAHLIFLCVIKSLNSKVKSSFEKFQMSKQKAKFYNWHAVLKWIKSAGLQERFCKHCDNYSALCYFFKNILYCKIIRRTFVTVNENCAIVDSLERNLLKICF